MISGGETTDSRGALQRIGDQPLGTAALAIVALGLAGYAIWRLTEALSNPAGLGRDAKDVFRRVADFFTGAAVQGVVHLVPDFFGGVLFLAGGQGDGPQGKQGDGGGKRFHGGL